eukprot:comp19239_c0_seq1/m.22013 comp19239_c0_seq1/g.22013  ORF comp19239_c0_seq1/g.22013 comp19239_c0_seq1/m.22013 type:complete len:195 (-) comp19239_c0_seq1:326-910(-)
MEAPLGFEDDKGTPVNNTALAMQRRYRKFLDDAVPHVGARWASTLGLLVLFGLRIFWLQGWFIVTYALAIYLLNLFIAFLSPRFEPAMHEDEEDGGPSLPTKADEEFKPFVRRLPEFKFWESATRATLIALGCTLFKMFDVPVFWPILVLYFCVLFAVTMKKQIAHMIRYKYLPFTTGKKKYAGKEGGQRPSPQ